jgi:hypothetical protein
MSRISSSPLLFFSEDIYRLRIAIDSEGVKFKVNEYTWTPGYGKVERNE